MKEKRWFLNTALAVVLGIGLLVCIVLRTFAPRMILPALDIPNMALVSLVALVLDHYVSHGAKRCYVCAFVFSALTFGLLPFVAGFVTLKDALLLAAVGGVVFTAIAWIFSSIQDRLSTGPAAKAAPVLSALGLYLAAQCFAGFII